MCCPCYAIRLDVLKFKPNKGQKSTLKKFKHFINSGEHTKAKVTLSDQKIIIEPNLKPHEGLQNEETQPQIGPRPSSPIYHSDEDSSILRSFSFPIQTSSAIHLSPSPSHADYSAKSFAPGSPSRTVPYKLPSVTTSSSSSFSPPVKRSLTSSIATSLSLSPPKKAPSSHCISGQLSSTPLLHELETSVKYMLGKHFSTAIEQSGASFLTENKQVVNNLLEKLKILRNKEKSQSETRGELSSTLALEAAGVEYKQHASKDIKNNSQVKEMKKKLAERIADLLAVIINNDPESKCEVANKNGYLNFNPNTEAMRGRNIGSDNKTPVFAEMDGKLKEKERRKESESEEVDDNTGRYKKQKSGEAHKEVCITKPPLFDLQIRLVPSAFTQESFELFRKYQILRHNDSPSKLTPKFYTDFLVTSPLLPTQDERRRYGSFHQQYRLNQRLIAVNVIDILPHGMNSVYFYYDPDFAFLSLGIVSALYDIDWVASQYDCDFRYYYLGYYVHSCSKTRYKNQFHSTEILCPASNEWASLKEALPLLDKQKYVQFFSPRNPISPLLKAEALLNIRLLYRCSFVRARVSIVLLSRLVA
eukprot:TRINITY_DN1815_c0_g1_i1.p1 TRINITY_DN1815_c0_g1~~TRINITY_DN1815_c0_g1_i1.p1  ORF type:complete len:588 (-),score=125.28 TRINITY_DN1815_c0_g1_i1:358-2121(-)